METITGYFRVNPTNTGQWELAIYYKGFAPAMFKDRKIIGIYQTESQAYKAMEEVLITVNLND